MRFGFSRPLWGTTRLVALSLVTLPLVALLLVACSGGGEEAPAGTAATATATGTGVGTAPPTEPPTTPSTEPPATAEAPPSTEHVASTAALPLDALGVVEFVTGQEQDPALALEVPPRDEYSIGLSGRAELGERGMLFDYGAPDHDGAFWMKNTHVDLDIAFVGGDRRVISIRTMEAESLDLVYAAAPYQWAIEAPAGWYAAHAVEPGTEVRFLFDTPSDLGQR